MPAMQPNIIEMAFLLLKRNNPISRSALNVRWIIKSRSLIKNIRNVMQQDYARHEHVLCKISSKMIEIFKNP